MSKPLHKLLETLGLRYEDLTAEERRTYDEWGKVLAAPQVSLDDLRNFLPQHIASLEYEQNKYDNSKEKDLYLKACIRNAKMIQAFVTGPEQRKKWLEQHIEQRAKTINKQSINP